MKTEERELARIIRRDEGAPIKEIARRIGVAPSSVSRWVRDIQLTPAQQQELLRRNPAYNRQLSGTAIGKSYVNVYSKHSKKKRTNRLPYGTVRVTVSRTRVIQSIYGSIQEYAGFDRKAWLE